MSEGTAYEAVACCVDHSEHSRAVEARAAGLAEALGIPLWLVHVMKPAEAFAGGVTTRSVPMEELEGQLRGEAAAWLLRRASGEDGADVVLLEASLAGEAICDWAGQQGSPLLVAGRSERRGLRSLGSTATYLSANAPCDVLLVDVSDL